MTCSNSSSGVAVEVFVKRDVIAEVGIGLELSIGSEDGAVSGFITQDEKRAPQWVCDAGLEWTYRIAQSPRRLAKRYARGAFSTAALSMGIIRSRLRSA